MKFLEDEKQGIVINAIQQISDQLFVNWYTGNLDEGDFYADYCFADMCKDSYIREKFNRFYTLVPGDEYYLEVE